MVSLLLAPEAPPLTVWDDGTIRVAGTRVSLDLVIRAYRGGMTAEGIAARYGTIPLEDVYGVLRYYLRHRAEVDEYVARCDEAAAELRAEVVARQGPQPTREELLARRTFRTGERVPAGGVWRCGGAEVALCGGDVFPPTPTEADGWAYAASPPVGGGA